MTRTGYITYDAQLARLEDFGRRSHRVRDAREQHSATVSIRRAGAADRHELVRLAALDSADVPSGEVLIAEVAGEPRAAIDLGGGGTVADPFHRTKHLVELLGERARTMRETATPRRRLRLRYRTA
jgi:hypothetical protein